MPVAVAVAVGTAAVAVRRSHPIPAVIVTCGSMTAQAALGVDENTAFAPLLAAFLAIGTAGYLSTRPLGGPGVRGRAYLVSGADLARPAARLRRIPFHSG